MAFRVHATLCDIAAAEIEALQADGVTVTPSDVVLLNAIGHEIECPTLRMGLARGVPVAVGGVTLWPLTLAGADWFRRHCEAFTGIQRQTQALAYAMANGREELPEVDVVRVVTAWAPRLKCRQAEIDEAIRQVYDHDETIESHCRVEPDKKTQAAAGELSMIVTSLAGGRPEWWERQCSISYVVALIQKLLAQSKGDGARVPNDKMRLLAILAYVAERIRRRGNK
jgi:hypothetical protein